MTEVHELSAALVLVIHLVPISKVGALLSMVKAVGLVSLPECLPCPCQSVTIAEIVWRSPREGRVACDLGVIRIIYVDVAVVAVMDVERETVNEDEDGLVTEPYTVAPD